MPVGIGDDQPRFGDLEVDRQRVGERRRRVMGGVQHHHVAMRPDLQGCGGKRASRGQPTQTPMPAEACSIGLESQNFQRKRGADLARTSLTAAALA